MLDIALFSDIKDTDMLSLLRCLRITTKPYKKGDSVIKTGDKIDSIGIVLDGKVEVYTKDICDGKMVRSTLEQDGVFAETVVCSGIKDSPISVVALIDSEVLFIPYEKLVFPCEKACAYHKQLVKNILKVVAKKNLELQLQLELLGKRTTKEKLLLYLRTKMIEFGSNKFFIPLNRNQMADFLCVDRSAMSRELCNMRDEGMIKFNKNYFELIESQSSKPQQQQ